MGRKVKQSAWITIAANIIAAVFVTMLLAIVIAGSAWLIMRMF